MSSAPVAARTDDVHDIWRLRRQLEDWIAAQGIEQWLPGEVLEAVIDEEVGQRQWYVLRQQGKLAAALRLLWSDPESVHNYQNNRTLLSVPGPGWVSPAVFAEAVAPGRRCPDLLHQLVCATAPRRSWPWRHDRRVWGALRCYRRPPGEALHRLHAESRRDRYRRHPQTLAASSFVDPRRLAISRAHLVVSVARGSRSWQDQV